MLNSIRAKLTLSYLVIALLTVLITYGLLIYTSDQQLRGLVREQEIDQFQTDISVWYAEHGTWEGFTKHFTALHPAPQRRPGNHPPAPNSGLHGIVDLEYRLLVRYKGFAAGDILPTSERKDIVPVTLDDTVIAYIVPLDIGGILLKQAEELYLQRTNRTFQIAGFVAVCAALLMAIALTRVLIRPILDLTHASRAMNAGNLMQEVPIYANDELGELAETFNQMSAALATATRQRRQMTEDIAHDLATPLQVISGYIEAIETDQLSLTKARLGTIAHEVEHLQRLVADLDLLAQTDTHTLSLDCNTTPLISVLRRAAQSFRPLAARADIQLLEDVAAELPALTIDEERLLQVLGNLINNALRYTPANGTITIAAQAVDEAVHIQVKDTGSGINPADLPNIFDRFYRADTARTNVGNSGLGLAISKGLIEAMNGTISARPNQPNGAIFEICLPVTS